MGLKYAPRCDIIEKIMDVRYYEGLIEGQFYEQFNELYEMLIKYNQMYNITAITRKNDVFLKHFLDSAVGESYFPHGAKVCEIGSGGGFPSVPLKILRDDLSFCMIESTGKKCSYLQAVVDNFSFSGMKVMNIRAEEGARDKLLREKFDVATARAVARLNTLCEYCLPFVKVGGSFVAYKGDCDDEVKEAANAIKILGGQLEKVDKFELGGEKRALVIIKKVAPTPEKYPRGRGLERKKPL